jgi:hypothetical protein
MVPLVNRMYPIDFIAPPPVFRRAATVLRLDRVKPCARRELFLFLENYFFRFSRWNIGVHRRVGGPPLQEASARLRYIHPARAGTTVRVVIREEGAIVLRGATIA